MVASIIFHHPHPLHPEGGTGHHVRPALMLNGFRQLGLSVDVVAGKGHQRAKAIDRIKKEAAQGRKFCFMYSESSTSPTMLTEPDHLHIYPFLDFGFFRLLRELRIPIGLFYRDIHWRFPLYKRTVPYWKRVIKTPLYWSDWYQYSRYVDILFLPSTEMAHHLPTTWPNDRLVALPPGCNVRSNTIERKTSNEPDKLHLFYVGSISPDTIYNITPLLNSVQGVNDVHLVVCCPEEQWKAYKNFYSPYANNAIEVVHETGDALAARYEKADICFFVVEPSTYLDFAMPMKVFEAMGYSVPIITLEGTGAAQFIASEGVGWVIRSSAELRAFYNYLNNNRQILEEKRRVVSSVREKHTWRARASKVVETLFQ